MSDLPLLYNSAKQGLRFSKLYGSNVKNKGFVVFLVVFKLKVQKIIDLLLRCKCLVSGPGTGASALRYIRLELIINPVYHRALKSATLCLSRIAILDFTSF